MRDYLKRERTNPHKKSPPRRAEGEAKKLVIIISVLLSVVVSVITSYVVLQWHLRIWDGYMKEITEIATDTVEHCLKLHARKDKKGSETNANRQRISGVDTTSDRG